jgi:TonB-linked SusC/RagA family outer membrane protein
MMRKKIIYNLFLFGIIVSGSIMHAQSVKGNVSDSRGPIPQVNVVVKGTSLSTSTDFDGNYSLNNVSADAVLVFSYIGYKNREIAVNGQTVVDAKLESDSQKLDEVIVVGYSSLKKQSITGAVSQVNMGELAKAKVSDVGQALQGQVAGVSVSANTGAPGDGLKIRIRGESTLGNNDVLYVVDGVATRDISFLNMSDVKSMTVLKDAAATAIYGSRSAGGVVILTTKSGSKGKSNIDVEYYSGTNFATNLPKMLNANQYLTVMDQAWHNSNNNPAGAISPYKTDQTNGNVNGIPLSDTNWLDQLFTSGRTNNLQLSVSGGSEKTQYLISGGYFGQDGIVVGDNDTYRRINFRTNINTEVTDRFKVGTNLQITSTRQDKMSSSGDAPGVIRHALLRPSVLGVYKDVNDPTYKANDPYTDLPFYLNNNPNGGWSQNYEFTSNPLAIVHFTDDVRSAFKTFGNVYGEYAFLADKSLKFKSNLGAEITFDHNKNFAENFGDDNDNSASETYPGQGRQNRPSSLNENRGEETTFTFANTLNYTKTIADKHSISALLGSETVSFDKSAVGGSRQNYNNTTDPFRYLDYGSDVNKHSSGSAESWNLISFFGSANYGYDNKYLVSGTIRADGSSRFGPNNKWGYFPSVSGGWVMSKEKFMENAKWISNLKWRASWGQSGNQEIPNNAYETLVTETGGIVNIVRYGNPDLKWETTTQTNFGADLSVLDNKLTFSADYFDKTTDDILLTVGLPSSTVGQINRTYVNAGVVTNKGFEFGANFQNNDHEFKYGFNANIATLKNNVEQLQQYVTEIVDDKTHTKTVVGQPISSYYGLQFDGIYQNAAEVSSTLFSNENGAKPGDIKFKDLNGDGQINADDRTFIGSSIPKVTYGFSFNAEYKRFDMSFLFQGVSGVDRYNDLKQILDYDSRPFNSTTAVLGAWNGEGTSNTTPRNTLNDNGGSQVSSVFVEDASYLRLKNLEIGYTFNPKIIGDTYLRMYVSGQNLLTFTNYTGLDPESTSFIDQGTYPQSTSILIGLKFKI